MVNLTPLRPYSVYGIILVFLPISPLSTGTRQDYVSRHGFQIRILNLRKDGYVAGISVISATAADDGDDEEEEEMQ
ncbi:unnamed protein product [Schistocephalus solidus]|uniref:Secreted protein n=1 Tax=Schistocephalus solidus TaxID=70667 RepID=A0A183TFL8_SCHSO|nr:unnamed protein product [Schistocephalus solidus]